MAQTQEGAMRRPSAMQPQQMGAAVVCLEHLSVVPKAVAKQQPCTCGVCACLPQHPFKPLPL
jgi:hypothetical protein